MNEKQEAEVSIAVFEAYCTEISASAGFALANTVEKTEIVIDIAATSKAAVTVAAAVPCRLV